MDYGVVSEEGTIVRPRQEQQPAPPAARGAPVEDALLHDPASNRTSDRNRNRTSNRTSTRTRGITIDTTSNKGAEVSAMVDADKRKHSRWKRGGLIFVSFVALFIIVTTVCVKINKMDETITSMLAGMSKELQEHTGVRVAQSSAVEAPAGAPGGNTTGGSTSGGGTPECNNATSPTRLISTYSSDLKTDVLQTCSRADGIYAWRLMLGSGGLVVDTMDPVAFAASVNSGISGICVLRVEGGAESTIAIEVLWTVHAGQDVRIVVMGGSTASVTFESSLTVQESGVLAFVNGFKNVTFDGGVNAAGIVAFPGSIETLAFGRTLVLQEDVAFPEDMTSLTFGSTLTVHGDAAFPKTLETLAFNGAVTLHKSVTFPAALEALAFDGTVNAYGDLILPKDMTSLTFGGTLTLHDGVTVAITSATIAARLAFQGQVHVYSSARLLVMLGHTGASVDFQDEVHAHEAGTIAITAIQPKMALAFRDVVTVDAGAALTVDGSIHVDYVNAGYGLWPFTNARNVEGECTLKNGVTFEEYDGSTISVVGTLPGRWTATDPNNSNAVVGTVERADGAAAIATWSPLGWHKDVWESRRATPNAVTNKRGNQFALHLLPQALTFSYDDAGYEQYAAACASAGLKMVMTGYSSYFETYCRSTTCIPLPYTDENGQDWGSTSDVDNGIHAVTGWDDFVIHRYDAERPYNYPRNAVRWETPKRPVCGIEL